MVVQSRRFFDLRLAAATSRRLLEPRVEPAPVVPAPPPAPVVSPEEGDGTMAPFERLAVEYKVELWDALLEWTRRCMGVAGCFALDERGFMVASAGELGEVPPEVFLSAFAATNETVTPYAGRESLRSAVFQLGEQTLVTLLPVAVSGGEVLLGLIGARMPTAAHTEKIRTTIATEIDAFESSAVT